MNRGTHLSLGDIGRPEDRVVRIVNLHYEADSKDVHDFFGNGFTVLDFIRGVNPKTNKNTVGYVLLATEQERIDARARSGREILDREVNVIPAQGGFCISSSGDKLLPPGKDKHARAFSADESRDEAPPAVGDVEAFPLLGMAATPRLAARAPFTTPAREQPVQQRALQNRLLFVNNIGQGPGVNETSFRLFFGKYTVVDVKRPLDPRTNTPHPTAFVMLASAEERDEALHQLKHVPMQGRKVTLEVPKTFQNVDEQGFLPTSNENVATFSAFSRGPVADNAPSTSSFSGLDVREDLPAAPSNVFQEASGPPPTADGTNQFQHLLGRLVMTESRGQQQAQNFKATRKVDDERQAKNVEIIWGMGRDELQQRYLGQQRTLAPMPSGIEGPGQVITGPPMTPPAVFSSPFVPPHSFAPHGPPPDVDTRFRLSGYSWRLGGNQDPAHHVITEEAWYGSIQAAQQRKNELKLAKPTVAQRIIAEGGVEDDGKCV